MKIKPVHFSWKMSPEITIKKDYVLIKPRAGADFWEIQRGIARLFYVPEIPKKNRIWLFGEGPQKLTQDDLNKIGDIIRQNYPEGFGVDKTAIVFESGMQSDMAAAFARMTEDMPHEFRVFSNLAEAESWIKT